MTGSKDKHIILWDPRSGKSIYTVEAHSSPLQQVKWNPINGIYLLTGGRDQKIKLFDIRKMNAGEVGCFEGHTDPVLTM